MTSIPEILLRNTRPIWVVRDFQLQGFRLLVAIHKTLCHNKVVIHLRYEWVDDLVKRKFGGTASGHLVHAWPISQVAPERMTIWRWLTKRTEIPAAQILPLAGALDIDPIALFECSSEEYEVLCLNLMQEVAAPDQSMLAKKLRWAYDLIAPGARWPPRLLANTYFERDWYTFDFEHNCMGHLNYFQRIQLSAPPREYLEPQVFHFAFKSTGALRSIWRPYGSIMRDLGVLRLYHSRGALLEQRIDPQAKTVQVATWFGSGESSFRIASLHPFQARLIENCDLADECLQFPSG